MSSQGHSSSPVPSSRPSTPESSGSEAPEGDWPCSCGTGDGTGKYIQCDNEGCKVSWYHWECVQVTEEPAGTWLCPSCSPSAAWYIKQLVTGRAAPSPTSRSAKVSAPNSSKEKEQESNTNKKQSVKKGMTKEKPAPQKARSMSSNGEEQLQKGTATKKAAPEKPKPKWIGWVEMTSDGEEEYKKKVEAGWRVDDGVLGKRTRGSKAVTEEDGPRSRRLRTRSRPAEKKTVAEMDSEEEGTDTDSGKSFYQEEEDEEEEKEEEEDEEEDEEEEEESVHAKVSINKEASKDHEDSEDTMDLDDRVDSADADSADEPSDPPSDSEEEKHVSPDRAQTNSTSGRDDELIASQLAVDAREGSVDDFTDGRDADDMDINRDESVEASSSESSDASEYFSARSRTPTVSPNAGDAEDASSPSPERAPATSPADTAAASAHDHFSLSDDSMETDENDEGQVSARVTPAVESSDYAALYRHRGNDWGEHPESSVRSTLPRLG